jgi:thiol-disulfide isomerase/thioredoxin
MLNRQIYLGALCASILLLSGCDTDELKLPAKTEESTQAQAPAEQTDPQTQATQEQEEPAQVYELETTITTVDGEAIHIKSTEDRFIVEGYEGKIILFEVFAWWCPDCKAAVPALNNIQAKHSENVVVIALENDGISNDELRDYVNTNNLEYRAVAKGSSGSLVPYAKSKGGWSGEIPFVLVIDSNGEVYRSLSGPSEVTESTIESIIADLSE